MEMRCQGFACFGLCLSFCSFTFCVFRWSVHWEVSDIADRRRKGTDIRMRLDAVCLHYVHDRTFVARQLTSVSVYVCACLSQGVCSEGGRLRSAHRKQDQSTLARGLNTRKASCRWQTRATLAKRLHDLSKSRGFVSSIASFLSIACLWFPISVLYSNCVCKMRRFGNTRLLKLPCPWNLGQRSHKVIESDTVR